MLQGASQQVTGYVPQIVLWDALQADLQIHAWMSTFDCSIQGRAHIAVGIGIECAHVPVHEVHLAHLC